MEKIKRWCMRQFWNWLDWELANINRMIHWMMGAR